MTSYRLLFFALRGALVALLGFSAACASAQLLRSVVRPGSAEIEVVPGVGVRVFPRGIFPASEEATVPEGDPGAHETVLPSSIEPPPALLSVAPSMPLAQPWTMKENPRPEISLAMARTAWAYFDQNYQSRTGWFDSVAGYSSTTLWDVASGIAAVACAMQLGLVPQPRASEMLGRAIQTLGAIRLYGGELPNRTYHTGTAAMDGPQSAAGAGRGSGWSALDIGRLLIWLRLTSTWFPEHAPAIATLIKYWKFDRAIQNGAMYGTLYNGAREFLRQEGRLGYEQYSAQGYALWGMAVERAAGYRDTKPVAVGKTELLVDQRNLPFLTSEPFLLAAFELGVLDATFTQLTTGLYLAQQERWRDAGVLTAASEDSTSRPPWFVYHNVSYEGRNWHCVDHAGNPAPGMCGLSTKAALGWASIFDDEYALMLERAALPLHAKKGYWGGSYANGGDNTVLTINTNAVILEAALFRQRGRRAFALDFQ